MNIEHALRIFIESGTPEVGKGYAHRVPQDAALPSFAYRVSASSDVVAQSRKVVLCKATIQINAHGRSYEHAKQLEQIFKEKLSGYKGKMGDVDVEYCKTAVNDDWADVQELSVVSFEVNLVYLPKGA